MLILALRAAENRTGAAGNKECEEAAESRIRSASKGNDFWGMASAKQTVNGKLDLYSEEQKVKRILRERKQSEREQPQQKKPKVRDHER